MAIPSVKLLGGYDFPVVGLGTWQSDNEQALEDALNAALELGYRHIDTAYVYRNEHVIGRVLKEWLTSGKIKRDDLFITTKLPMEAINPDRVEQYIKKSLESLQLDYVDLYLIHFPICTKPRKPDSKEPIETEPTDHIAVWKKMEEQVDAGRTKTIGLSNFSIAQIDRVIKNSRIKPACLQVEIHTFFPQNELVKFAQDNGLVVVAYSPLANPSINKFYAKMGLPPKELPNMLTNGIISSIAKKHNKSNAQIMLKFLLQRNIVVIPKSVTATRLKENIDLFDFTLDGDDLTALRGLDQGEPARVCDFSFAKAFVSHPEWPFPARD
ncbi:hypothetical protein GWI33_006271 [Rhynchophorus ferrugineus]|uniref:NADP-dependent oxidoreductase domain-containing protein n=1 Tax=Rhynchophorus ferrugineus TaxID=354439 RepID=A0A834MD64_RHYFE|nr:hypothetical protein GWI33_006271 [Rhynchophorus ferrugineus]